MSKEPLWLGYQRPRVRVGRSAAMRKRATLPVDALVRHAFVCGSTGSGKTVYAKGLVEEVLLQGVPVIAIDLKGDITSMALRRDAIADAALMSRLFGDDASEILAEYQAGLKLHPQSANRAHWFQDGVDIQIFTPTSTAGHRIALPAVPSFETPPLDDDEHIFRLSVIAQGARRLAKRLYGPNLRRFDAEVKFIEALAGHQARLGRPMAGTAGIRTLMDLIKDPPFDELGGLELNEFIPPKNRAELRRRLSARLVGNEAEAFKGDVATMDRLTGHTPDGQTPLAIVHLAHLTNFDEQAAWIAHICTEAFSWSRRSGGSDHLKVLLYIDELGGGGGSMAFLPSYPKDPASKEPLVQLIKQGRSGGVGVLLATQNPMSVDPRSLANVNTWAIGKLTQSNDMGRLEGLLADLDWHPRYAREQIANPPLGHFLTVSSELDEGQWVQERWLYGIHRQLHLRQVREIHRWQEQRRPVGEQEPVAARHEPPSPAAGQQPDRSSPREHLARSVARSSPPQTDLAEPQTQPLDQHAPQTVPTRMLPGATPRRVLTVTADQESVKAMAGEEIVVGRSRNCTLTLRDDTVSRRHLRIRVEADGVSLEPMSSKNPVLLDGQRLSSSGVLPWGMLPLEVQLGRTKVMLRKGGG